MSESASPMPVGAVMAPQRRAFLSDFFSRLVKEKPLGAVGGIIVLLLLLTAILADVLAPYGFNDIHPSDFLQGPSSEYVLGTDNLGRDLLSRVIFGARISLIVGLSATTISILISTTLGILCGFLGGRFDMVVQRIVDAWMCFPGLILLIVMVSLVGPGLLQVIVVLGLQYGIAGSRVVRGAVFGIKGNVYIEAASAIGCTTRRTLLRHILPNVMAPIIILFTTRMPAIILGEASLSFLGLGIPPPDPSWGGMLSGSGRTYMLLNPYMALWPGLALSIVVYGINMFGDALRDLLDPRLRGGLGRYGSGRQEKARQKALAGTETAAAGR
jgi:peptide/nickel transport system permease protein